MNEFIFWKNPAPLSVMEAGYYTPAGVGRSAEMPLGATTGERDLPTALEVSWDAIQVGTGIKPEFVPVLVACPHRVVRFQS